MSKKTLRLKEKMEAKINAQEAIRKLLKKEKRGFSKKERKAFQKTEDDIEEIRQSIIDSEALDASKKRAASFKAPSRSEGAATPESKLSRDYSLLRALRMKSEGKELDGAEAEVHQEAVKEARESGISLSGIGLPSVLVKSSQRDLTVGVATTAGNLVGTDLQPMRAALEPKLRLEGMGATVMNGLVGDVDLPVGDALASASWAGENDDATATTPSTKVVSLKPKRLAAFTDISKQLIIQSSINVEAWVRDQLSGAVSRKVELAAYNGAGSSNEPLGILNAASTNNLAIGTNGGTITRAKLLEMITKIVTANAEVENMGYVITPELRGFLQNLKTDAGSGKFVWPSDVKDMLLGYKALTSNLLPKNLTKGTGTDLHASIFGDFSNLIIGNWGGADITVDPFTKAGKGQIVVTTNTFWDVGIVHPKGFSVIKDIAVA